MVVGIQILEIVDGLPGVLSLKSMHNGLSDKISIYLLLVQLPSQVRKVKFTAQWKISGQPVEIEIDTGTKCNVITLLTHCDHIVNNSLCWVSHEQSHMSS